MNKLNPNMKQEALAFIKSKFQRTKYFDYAYSAAKKIKGVKLASYVFRLFEKQRSAWPKEEGRGPDCARGCWYCCTLKVDIEKCEALYLARYIKKNFSKAEVNKIKARAIARFAQTEGKGTEWNVAMKLPCVLLDDTTKECIAYDGRPLACRRTFSYRVDMCKSGYEGTTNGNWWWAAPFLISEDILGGIAYASLEEDRYEEMTIEGALTKYL